jgi:hypothetical protein
MPPRNACSTAPGSGVQQAADRLVEAAGDALYRAKTAGSDRAWPDPPEAAAGEGARGETAPDGTADR